MNAYNLSLINSNQLSGSLNLLSNVSENGYVGITTTLSSSQNMSFGQLVFMTGSVVALSHASGTSGLTSSLFSPAIAISVEAVSSNTQRTFLLSGIISSGSWTWSPGQKLYVGKSPGSMTQSISGYSSGDTIQVAAIALTATKIYFNPSYDLAIVQ